LPAETAQFFCFRASPGADANTAASRAGSVVAARAEPPAPGRIVHYGAAGELRLVALGRSDDMEVTTSRFGKLQAPPSDILLFEQGLIGLRNCRRWVVLADAQNPALGWLQCVDDPELAVGVVSPRRFVPDYQLRVSRQDLAPLGLASARDAQVVVIVSRHAEGLSLNLRAPLVINVEARRGRQVVAKDSLPVRLTLSPADQMRLTA
jgi:flagellar assembly factor FliW